MIDIVDLQADSLDSIFLWFDDNAKGIGEIAFNRELLRHLVGLFSDI